MRLMSKHWQLKLQNLEDFSSTTQLPWSSYDVVLVLTSTYGSGSAPGSAGRCCGCKHLGLGWRL